MRSTRTIKLTPHTEVTTTLTPTKGTNSLKQKHVEFADDPQPVPVSVVTTATDGAGFITTV